MKKPSIIILSDFPDWAFGFITKFIVAQLSDKYDLYYDYMIYNDYQRETDTVLPALTIPYILQNPISGLKRFRNKLREFKNPSRRFKILSNKYDAILYLDYYIDLKGNFKYKSDKTIRGIYTDGFPPFGLVYDYKRNLYPRELAKEQFVETYLRDTDALVVGSISNIDQYKDFFNPVYFANMCYDTNLFSRGNYISKKDFAKKFTIGWTGNPSAPFKNYNSFIIPLIEELQFLYPEIIFKTRFGGAFETLAEFYMDVDIVIIASDADAGPSLFMEAALMDVPAVSTNVGFPSFIIKNGINGYILEKNTEAFKNVIIQLYQDSDLLEICKSNIRKDFLNAMGPEIMKSKWDQIFSDVLYKHNNSTKN